MPTCGLMTVDHVHTHTHTHTWPSTTNSRSAPWVSDYDTEEVVRSVSALPPQAEDGDGGQQVICSGYRLSYKTNMSGIYSSTCLLGINYPVCFRRCVLLLPKLQFFSLYCEVCLQIAHHGQPRLPRWWFGLFCISSITFWVWLSKYVVLMAVLYSV